MNDQEMIELGKRAVACEGFRWMPGMLDEGERVLFAEDLSITTASGDFGITDWSPRSVGQPDLRDPATLGCLLHLVREAWGEDDRGPMCTAPFALGGNSNMWSVERAPSMDTIATGDTEAEALVAALEAAPKRGAA